MCTTFADYWECGHFRRNRLVLCSRRFCYLGDERGKTYVGTCGRSACEAAKYYDQEDDYEDDDNSRNGRYYYYYVRRRRTRRFS